MPVRSAVHEQYGAYGSIARITDVGEHGVQSAVLPLDLREQPISDALRARTWLMLSPAAVPASLGTAAPTRVTRGGACGEPSAGALKLRHAQQDELVVVVPPGRAPGGEWEVVGVRHDGDS